MKHLAHHLRVLKWSSRSSLSRGLGTAVGLMLSMTYLVVVSFLVFQTDAQQAQVIDELSSEISRQIVLRPESGRFFTESTVDLLVVYSDVEWVVGLGSAQDLQSDVTGRQIVGRRIYRTALPSGDARFGTCTAGPLAVAAYDVFEHQLGHAGTGGSVTSRNGTQYALISAPADLPNDLIDRADVELRCSGGEPRLVAIVLQVREVKSVPAYASLIRRMAIETPTLGIESVQSSEAVLAFFEGSTEKLSRSYTNLLVVASVAVSFVSLIWNATQAANQRQDFGRRRALGASKRMLLWSSIIETATLVLVSATAGSVVVVVAQVLVSPWASLSFWVPSVVLLLISSLAGALLPAFDALRRDPITVLRSS